MWSNREVFSGYGVLKNSTDLFSREGASVIFGRDALYFDEVAKRGSVRRAAEYLHIAPSAVNHQILQLERSLGVPLFERLPQGMRLTTAGEMLIETVRRWRRDLRRVQSHLDDLQGLRRGEVSVALVEGAVDFFSESTLALRTRFPGIAYRLHAASSLSVADLVISGEYEIGITFNPQRNNALRTESKLTYHFGVVAPPGHPLAARSTTSLAQVSQYPLVVPDETMSLRRAIDETWAKVLGHEVQYSAVASNVHFIKSMVRNGFGLGLLTPLDVLTEVRSKELVFISLSKKVVPPSVACIVSASGRMLSVPASMVLRHLSQQLSLMAAD
jgi:DNA-binding transcriptional LysR family regulator